MAASILSFFAMCLDSVADPIPSLAAASASVRPSAAAWRSLAISISAGLRPGPFRPPGLPAGPARCDLPAAWPLLPFVGFAALFGPAARAIVYIIQRIGQLAPSTSSQQNASHQLANALDPPSPAGPQFHQLIPVLFHVVAGPAACRGAPITALE